MSEDQRPSARDSVADEYRFKFARAVFAFIALPVTNAFVIPLWMAPRHPGPHQIHWLGVPVILTGIFILLWCVRDFYVAGKGTLAPWSPPKKLVIVGLYRVSRNPMYVGVLAILFGWSLWFMSRGLLLYALAFVIAFHLRVVYFEEPWLARTHGDEFERYKSRTARWFTLKR